MGKNFLRFKIIDEDKEKEVLRESYRTQQLRLCTEKGVQITDEIYVKIDNYFNERYGLVDVVEDLF